MTRCRWCLIFPVLLWQSWLSAQAPPDSLLPWMPLRFHACLATPEYRPLTAEAGLQAGFNLQSDALPLPFSRALLTGRFLDSTLKEQAAGRLQALNHARLQVFWRLYARWKAPRFLGGGPALLEVGFNRFDFTAARFTTDAFGTVFFGNSRYAGQWTDYDQTAYLHYLADQLDFSATKNLMAGNWLVQAGAGINLGVLQRASRFCMKTGDLYTDAAARFLDAAYDFQLTAHPARDLSAFKVAGWMAAAGMHITMRPVAGKTSLSLWVNDLGWLHWGRGAYSYRADSTVHFTGIVVDNFFSAGEGSSFLPYSVDSFLVYTGARRTDGPANGLLPFTAAATVRHQWTPAWVVAAGIVYEHFSSDLPYLLLRPAWQWQRWQLGVNATVGGIAEFALGADLARQVGQHWGFRLAAGNLLAAVIPAGTGSASLFLNVWMNR